MRVAIIGAGAMGQMFGALLVDAGNDVTLVETDPKRIEAIETDGFTASFGERTVRAEAPVGRAGVVEEPVELAVLLTKTYDSERALEEAEAYIGPDTRVLTLQNGIGNAELLARHVGEERALVGISTYNSDLVSDDYVMSSGEGFVRFMPVSGVVGDAEREVERVFCEAGLDCEVREDIEAQLWGKVALDAALNATCAICRVPAGGMAAMNKGMDLMSDVIDEACDVAAAYGIEVNSGQTKSVLRNLVFGEGKDHKSSMTLDVLARRRTEANSVNGGIVAKAREAGVEVPHNETLFCLLRTIESTYDMQLPDGR